MTTYVLHIDYTINSTVRERFMTMSKTVSVRVDVEDYKYLKLLALSSGQPITNAITSLVREREDAEPMSFKIVNVIGPDGEMYDVTVNGKGTQVCFSNTMDVAMTGLADFRKKHGYDVKRFKLESEMEVLDLRDFAPSEQITLDDVKRARVTWINTH
jgi:hypothetical protein